MAKCQKFKLPEGFVLNYDNLYVIPAGGEGYTPLGICYGVTKSEEKLLRFAGDPRLPNIFINEVCKNALRPGDPRWETKHFKENNQ